MRLQKPLQSHLEPLLYGKETPPWTHPQEKRIKQSSIALQFPIGCALILNIVLELLKLCLRIFRAHVDRLRLLRRFLQTFTSESFGGLSSFTDMAERRLAPFILVIPDVSFDLGSS